MAEPALKAIKSDPQIMPERVHLANHQYRRARLIAEAGLTKEQVLRPEFFAHIARNFTPGDIFEVWPEDESFYGELLVIASGKGYIKTHVLRWDEIRDNKPSVTKDGKFSVEWKGPRRRFAVIRNQDNQIVQDGFQTAVDGQTWLDTNMGTLT